jgi:protein O-mannosyl-transferase
VSFHVANVLMHALSAVAVLQILRRLIRNDGAALVGAAIYALHPVQVESVGWISGGKDVLSGMLSLVAIWMYLRAVDPQERARSRTSYIFATIAFVLATLAKPQAVATPLVAMVIDVAMVRRDLRAALRSLAIWFVWCVPVVAMGRFAQPANLLKVPLLFRPVVALDALAFYAGKLLLPVNLVVDYGRSPEWLAEATARFWTWAIALALFVVCLALRRKSPWLLAGVLVLCAALVPVLGLIPFDYQMYSTVADHYLYVAMLGPSLLVAVAVSKLRNPQMKIVATALVVACGVISFRHARYWRDTHTLFERTLELNPTSLAGNGMLGVYWSEHGDVQLALGLLAENVRNHPHVPFAHYIYGNVLLRAELYPNAVRELQQAATMDPSKPKYFTSLGVALGQSGRLDLAMQAFARSATMDPTDADNFQNAGLTLENMGRFDEARQAYVRALQLDPSRSALRAQLRALHQRRAMNTTAPAK